VLGLCVSWLVVRSCENWQARQVMEETRAAVRVLSTSTLRSPISQGVTREVGALVPARI
jgi:hypothetical protein